MPAYCEDSNFANCVTSLPAAMSEDTPNGGYGNFTPMPDGSFQNSNCVAVNTSQGVSGVTLAYLLGAFAVVVLLCNLPKRGGE
jgi:hypothetical protein